MCTHALLACMTCSQCAFDITLSVFKHPVFSPCIHVCGHCGVCECLPGLWQLEALALFLLTLAHWVQDQQQNKYEATVTGGTLHAFGREVPLPFLRGKGAFCIRYLGRKLRIFENPGSALAVQVRPDLIE